MKQPKNPFHPGEILLEEFLSPSNITQMAFAKKLGWTRARLNELIKGKRGITAEAALDLAKALEISGQALEHRGIPAIPFTRAGEELQNLIEPKPNFPFIKAAATYLRGMGLTVKKGVVTENDVDGKTISFVDEF